MATHRALHMTVLRRAVQSDVGIASSFHLIRLWPWRRKIRGVEIVFTSDADEGEQGVAPAIGEGGPHAMRLSRIGNSTDRPVRGDPFARGVSQHGRQIDD